MALSDLRRQMLSARAGVVVSRQTACPLALGDEGIWNHAGVLKYRLSSGVDVPLSDSEPSLVTAIKTSAYSPALGEIVRVNPTSAGFTLSLPAGATADAGQKILIKNVSSSVNVVTLSPNGSQTIDGSASFAMNQALEAVALIFDGTSNWMVA